MIPAPKRALQFLRWFCREDFLDEIEGDLLELYELEYATAPKKARRQFYWNVIQHFRPAYIKLFHQTHKNITLYMFKNDLKIASRMLKKRPFLSFLNIMGLAIGIAGSLIIGLQLKDELTFNQMFADAERIYRVNIDNRTNGETNYYASVSGPLAETMRNDCPQIEQVMRFKNTGGKLIRKIDSQQHVKEEFVVGADSSFFDLFGLDLLVGNKETALKLPNTVVLTRTAAEKHFPLHKALGQQLMIDDEKVYQVTGVIEDLPKNSFLRNHTVFLSLESFADARSTQWNNWSFPTFVKLHPQSNPADFNVFLDGVLENYLIPWAMTFIPNLTVESARKDAEKTGNFMRFNATALTDIHLYSQNRSGEFSQNSDIKNVYILCFIGCLLLLLACINFMNLSTAYSLKRSKEVGIRKTLGSKKGELIRQFLSEAFLVTFLAFVLGFIIAYGSLPFFNNLVDKSLTLPFGQPVFWLLVLVAMVLLTLLSGTYPAFFISKFRPINALQVGKQSNNNQFVRQGLIVFQFTISVLLIICTIVVYQQLQYMQNKELGYQKDQILVLENLKLTTNKLKTFKEQIQGLPKVEKVTLSSYLPTPSKRGGITFFQKDKLFDSESAMIIENWDIDEDYISTLNMEIIAGRDFNKLQPTDSTAIILNESAVKMLNVPPEEAIGIKITSDFKEEDTDQIKYYTIIGVVKNFHFESLRNDIDAVSLSLGKQAERMLIRVEGQEISNTLAAIKTEWKKAIKGQAFDFYFLNDAFNRTFKAEQKLGQTFALFTLLSIFIACLGLFGLTVFNVENKVKEIGIRKVLGASTAQISYKLSIDFLKLIAFSIFIAAPLGWYMMNKWLADFSYRIDIAWWMILLAAFIAILIALATLSYQSIKAAMTNPINCLRKE
jgi:putative ABC transport system permease protein